MDNQIAGIIPQVLRQPKAFSASFVAIFLLSYIFLGVVGATPDPKTVDANTIAAAQGDTDSKTQGAPVRVVAHSVSLDAKVNNPTSTSIDVLDNALLTGAVRYPTSAVLGAEGTVLLFGHSSYLPVVYNQAYKAFNEIQNLKTGQTISVYSVDREYRYEVVSVRLADATEDVVELPQTGKHLVLVTCDTFTRKTSRFIVTADFVGSYALASS